MADSQQRCVDSVIARMSARDFVGLQDAFEPELVAEQLPPLLLELVAWGHMV